MTERTVALPGALDLDRSLPPIGSDARRPRFGTDPAPHAAGAVICCPSNCEGQACSNARTLMRKLAAELILLDSRVRSISRKDYHSSNEVRALSSCLFAFAAASASPCRPAMYKYSADLSLSYPSLSTLALEIRCNGPLSLCNGLTSTSASTKTSQVPQALNRASLSLTRFPR